MDIASKGATWKSLPSRISVWICCWRPAKKTSPNQSHITWGIRHMNDQPRFCVGKYPLELTQNHDTFLRKHVLFNKKTSIKSAGVTKSLIHWPTKINFLATFWRPFLREVFLHRLQKCKQGIGIFGHLIHLIGSLFWCFILGDLPKQKSNESRSPRSYWLLVTGVINKYLCELKAYSRTWNYVTTYVHFRPAPQESQEMTGSCWWNCSKWCLK